MEQPLTVGSEMDAQSGHGQVAIPACVAPFIRLVLGGPGPASLGKARLWAAAVGLYDLVGAYLCTRFALIDETLTFRADPMAAAACVFGALFSYKTHRLWRELCLEDGSDGTSLSAEPHGDDGNSTLQLEQSHGFWSSIISAEISPETASKIESRVKKGRSSMVPMILCMMIVWAVFIPAYLTSTRESLWSQIDVIMCASMLVLLQPAVIVSTTQQRFVGELARMVVVDRIERITEQVQRSTVATVDFDALLRDCVTAQHLVLAVSTEIEWMLKIGIGANVCVGSALIFVGLVPQPPDVEMWWNKYHVAIIVLIVGALFFMAAINVLMQPAKVTSACERLADAINELRSGTASDAVVRTVSMTDSEKIAIEHLLGCAH